MHSESWLFYHIAVTASLARTDRNLNAEYPNSPNQERDEAHGSYNYKLACEAKQCTKYVRITLQTSCRWHWLSWMMQELAQELGQRCQVVFPKENLPQLQHYPTDH